MINAEHPPSLAADVTLDEVLSQALDKALACHADGYFAEAEQLYRAILQAQPEHAVANHQFGLLEIQRQQPAAALPYFLAALEASPESCLYWLSYIDTLLLTGQEDTARQVLELGRQHGLTGNEVEALALRLPDNEPPAPSPADEKPWPAVRASKATGNRARGRDAEPSAAEESMLMALFSAGRYSEGENLARTLTERFSQHGFGWKVWGTLLKAQGRDSDALPVLRQAAKLLPRDAEVQSNLGLVLFDMGKLPEAAACQRRALKIRPEFAEAHYNLANVRYAQGKFAEAAAGYQRALALKPDFPRAHCNLGNALAEQGDFPAADAAYNQALALQPDFAEAHKGLGRSLMALDRPDEALDHYRQALTLKPEDAQTRYYLGEALRARGRLDEAEAAFRRAVQDKPDFAEAHFNLGNTLDDQGRLSEAEAALRCALQYRPDFEGALYNLGNVLRAQERLSEAEASYRQALAIKPDMEQALLNLGVTLTELGRYGEGEAACRQAMALKPDYALAHSNLLFCLTHNENNDASALFAEHCRFGEQFETPLRAHWSAHGNRKDPERCLQVGFVSADFRNHAVTNFIEPVLAELKSHQTLSLHAYFSHAEEDHATLRLREHVRHWHPVAGLDDATLAEKIRADGIDILIDLSGHTAHHRLLAFARKPAPLQASWIGYPGTTGLQAMDYYLSDPFFLPRGEFDGQFTEKIVHLPCCSPFLPSPLAPSVSPLPALSQGHVTFGSFNRPTKISASVIALWAQLLVAVPRSRMLLGAMRTDGRVEQLIDEFARHGVVKERLSFHPRSAMTDYLELHQRVDICLDTFPYNGGTTTFHALWMGVPTLTLAGGTFPGQTGAGILGHVGLTAFITRNTTEFVERGAALAADLPLLAGLRDELRERLARSAFGQPALIAAALERALRGMWQRWCHGLPAESFEVRRQDLA
ncbi:MAG: tetratricopeptide repeat protein [Candidatus Accumulibacter sp.]|uniref:tetratricopeptide repeat protein n=1 Tax=Accumulibacter sp. TaxID=2053492 RepID=UPI00258A977E|nr:tetratricopeptide repeat protein [Accumulibacter sp.]MBK8117207.1 tetratricopeptide repeat protein [Accumulibacter sp.]